VSADKKRLCWRSRWAIRETSIDLTEVLGILVGPKSRRYQHMVLGNSKFDSQYHPWLCLSLVLRNRTIDLTFLGMQKIINGPSIDPIVYISG